ncbi:MAG: biopolymer transporter ExbD [Planctomycetota bacterium]|nr:biopolymer transporter ExbD [Planctomycetota bacterium]
MPAKLPEETKVEVDMVPYIDIVSLLLLFLVITGDMTKSATGVKMRLPRADQAQTEKKLGISTDGRIVVQMKAKDGKNPEAGYFAVVENHQYDLVSGGNNASLVGYLKEQVDRRVAKGLSKVGESGEVSFPVKLRIPRDAPMYQVERVVMTCAKAGLVNVHYAADNKDRKEE